MNTKLFWIQKLKILEIWKIVCTLKKEIQNEWIMDFNVTSQHLYATYIILYYIYSGVIYEIQQNKTQKTIWDTNSCGNFSKINLRENSLWKLFSTI